MISSRNFTIKIPVMGHYCILWSTHQTDFI